MSTVLHMPTPPTPALGFCQPCLERLNLKVPAARDVAGTAMCKRCFSGMPCGPTPAPMIFGLSIAQIEAKAAHDQRRNELAAKRRLEALNRDTATGRWARASGLAIFICRTARGMTQGDLARRMLNDAVSADALDVQRTLISRLERGATVIRPKSIARFAKAFGLEPAFFASMIEALASEPAADPWEANIHEASH